MKKIRLAALFVMAIVLASGVFSLGAAASEVSDSSLMLVSESDASGVVTPTDHIADCSFVTLSVPEHRLTFLAPELAASFRAGDLNADLFDALNESYGLSNAEELLNYSDYYGNSSSYLYIGFSENSDFSMCIMSSSTPYTEFIGDYARLDETRARDICDSSDLLGSGDPAELREINGKTWIYQENIDPETGSANIALESVVRGRCYNVFIEMSDPTDADYAVAETIVESIRLRGYKSGLSGTADSGLVTALAVCCGILLVVVGFLVFFLLRFNAFNKAAGSAFSLIGFNMPPKGEELEKLLAEDEQKIPEGRRFNARGTK